jgi:hypothetical protein
MLYYSSVLKIYKGDSKYMQRQMLKQFKKEFSLSNYPKYGAILLLLLLSVVVVACGAPGGTTTTAAAPQPTSAAINLNITNNLSPTPTLPPQTCGIWVTDPSITYGSSFNVYAEFNSMNQGNPQGIAGTAQLTIQWGDGSTSPATIYTSSTGVGYASIPTGGHIGAENRLSLITAVFTSGNITCSVDTSREASFTLVPGAPAQAPAAPTNGGNNNGGGNNGGNNKHH